MTSVMMSKEQSEKIQRIQEEMLERTNMTENEAYDFAFRCWQCGLDFTKELEKENQELKVFVNAYVNARDELLIENEELELDKKILKGMYKDVITTAIFYMSKYEKLEKVIEILKNKRVDLDIFMNCKTLEEYNNAIEYTYKSISENYKLTQEEYNLLKEVLE